LPRRIRQLNFYIAEQHRQQKDILPAQNRCGMGKR
jgi:hypothetical protein